jgi:arginyl-tRNA synthetase
MEDGDEEVLKQWHGWRELILKKYKEAYHQLNIEFDLYIGESTVRKGIDREDSRAA